jgi:triosephosphate isomerase
MIVVNFKAYLEVCGKNGLILAEACKTVSEETGVRIIACPQMTDLALIKEKVGCETWAQSLDDVGPGGRTGHTTVEAVKGAGATGALINHSECRKLLFDIGGLIKKCNNLDIVSCVCTNYVNISKAAASMGPTYIAIEPPELIGGDISVTTADPVIVSKTVDIVKDMDKDVEVLCGAGIKSSEDVAKALELGAGGVLLASGVVKAKDPFGVLRDLSSAL